MSDEREPCEECNDCGLASGPQGHQVYCGCIAGLMAFEQQRQKSRTITRADIPEELVDELKRKWENDLLDNLEGESCQSLVRSLLERNTGG